jgi:hypothetical protein
MPTLSKTRWLLVLWVPALISTSTFGQSPANVSPQEARLSSSALQQSTGGSGATVRAARVLLQAPQITPAFCKKRNWWGFS